MASSSLATTYRRIGRRLPIIGPLRPIPTPITNLENALSAISPPLGFRSCWSLQSDKYCKRMKHNAPSSSAAAASPCSHRSPDTPLLSVADSDPSSSGSDGFFSSLDMPPLKRFHAGETATSLTAPASRAKIDHRECKIFKKLKNAPALICAHFSRIRVETSPLRSPAQARQSKFLLPDLNDPAPESHELDTDGE
ncbi:hypothetical protein KSP40_PGU018722 [Platanthera guangdongensis]|uniref:Uncharacterized protein n=1 Tax=Platanthera guangdongensis TaxID=2320717 RepID=A0ABR2LG57_9ASPA